MRAGKGYQRASARAAPVSEDFVILIIVVMLTSMTVVLSGAPALALNFLAVLA